MTLLPPSNMETSDYGSDGWNAIYSSNFEKLNNHLGTAMKASIPKTDDFEIIGSTNDDTVKALVVYNSDVASLFSLRNDKVCSITSDTIITGTTNNDTKTALSIKNSDSTEIVQIRNDRIVFLKGSETRIGGSSNYTKVDSSGHVTLQGTATVWDDLLVPAISTKLGGSKDPGFAVFQTNGGGSQGVFLYWFDATAEEELYFIVQMPHCWKEGSTIYPHVHWVPATTSDGDPASQKVRWGLEYTWSNMGSTFGNTTIIYGEDHSPSDANVVASKHYLTDINGTSGITGTGQTISSILVCRIFRDATHANDTYEHDAGLLHIDFHYEIDSLGSNTVTSKT